MRALTSCFIFVKYLYLALLRFLNIRCRIMSEPKEKKSMGQRPEMGSVEKAMARAARAWHKLQEANSKKECDYRDERIQFAHTDTNSDAMGRPATTYKDMKEKGYRNQFHAAMMIAREEAQKEWGEALQEYRATEKEFGVDPIPEADIRTLRKHTKVGRPAADKVDKLKKYIRRETRRADEIQAEIDAGMLDPEPSARGRKRLTRAEKVKQYRERVSEAQQEVNELIAAMPKSERIRHEMNDLRVESRQLTVFKKTPDHPQNKSIDMDPHSTAHQQIASQRQLDIQVELQSLERKRRAALGEEKNAAEQATEQKHQEAFDRKFNEIEQRENKRSENFDRLREQQRIEQEEQRKNDLLKTAHARMLEAENAKLMEAIRKMGGDPEAILKQLDDEKKTG